jgi:mono/diheme cytochrome c family protein
MTRRLGLIVASALLYTGSGPVRVGAQAQSGPAANAAAASPERRFVTTYCATCHNARLKTAELALDTIDVSDPASNPAVWEKVLQKVRTGVMPPPQVRHPDPAAIASFLGSIEGSLDRAATAHPNPGRVPLIHRLNRTEYRDAIRDLLAVDDVPKEMDISLLLPPDEIGEGFDNMAAALFVSPSLIERYVGAARKISRLAVGDLAVPRMIDTYQLSGQLPQDVHLEELPLGTRGGVLIRRTFPVDGEYTFDVQVARGGVYDPSTAGEGFELELTVDGARAQLFKEERRQPAAGDQRQGRRGGGGGPLQARIAVTAGPHDIGVAFLQKAAAPIEALVTPYVRGRGVESAAVSSVTISGPEKITGVGNTPSRQRIFVCHPVESASASAARQADSDAACANRILSGLARRAFRRPVNNDDVAPLLQFYIEGRKEGGFDDGIKRALERLLVSPEFLFRIEFDPGDVRPDALYRISDLELASRLSFFLWSSIPDDELIDLGARGTLHTPKVLDQQVRRMIADRRSADFVENFAGQWLFLRDFVAVKRPDDRLFPNFDEGLRHAMAEETRLFVEAILREDRSVLDLLGADFTFLNDRLARHYGIPDVYGSSFRRVTLPPDSPRRGLLGQGSMLTVTSYANRTSPVNRGKFILETLLSMPPPPPPPDVPSLKDTSEDGHVLSMRARMEQHRTNPACASCHAQMDPLGFALEQFDAVGEWRTRGESHEPIDASAALANGARFTGVAGLRQVLLAPPYNEEFVRTVVSKMLSYALGRGIEPTDQPYIRAIMKDAAPGRYGMQTLVRGIINSVPFQMRRARVKAD